MTWKPDICLYHAACDDGFGAAAARFGGGGHRNAAGFKTTS